MTASRRIAPLPLAVTALLALLALVLGGVLLWSTPSEAQTITYELISNTAQGNIDDLNTSNNDHAQLFHTGANTGATAGWVLTSLTVVSADANEFDVDICEEDGTSDEFPTTTCTTLKRPSAFAIGSLIFTHRGIYLNANDNYVVVIRQDGADSVTLDTTTSAGEDSSGQTGWSIKNKFDWKNSGAWQQKDGGNEALRMTIRGYETPANQDATGRPIIVASAEGAPILFAEAVDIRDGNGLPLTDDSSVGGIIEFVYSYQWIRVDGVTQTNIGGDSPRYRLVDADIGNLIKVEVSFTDQHNYSETVTSLPFGPVLRPAADPSLSPATLVSNTGQTHSATANITMQYAQGFTLGDHGQGYELSSVSIELAAVPSDVTVSLWIGDHSDKSSIPETKLYDFENPATFTVGLNRFTAPAGVLLHQNVHYAIVLSDFGASLSIKETTSDGEDAGGETGAELGNTARVRALNSTGRWGSSTSRSSVLRLALEGSKRASGILASTYAQTASSDQEIISVGDDCCISVVVGSADRYLIRGFSWNSDDTTDFAGGLTNPWRLIEGSTKLFRLSLTRSIAGVPEYSAPQGATVEGGSTKTYALSVDWDAYDHVGDGSRTGHALIRIHGTQSTNFDTPSAPGVTFSARGDVTIPGLLAAILGEPLHAMVQNLGQTDNSYALADGTNPVLSQGFTTSPNAGGYELQGVGVNIEGSSSEFPDGPTSVSVAVHADADGKPAAKLFDLVSPTEYAAGHSFFEAPAGTTLEPSTSYVLVWRHLGGTAHRLQRTLSDSEDAGAFADFSIADAFYRGADVNNLTVNSGGNSLEIAVYGEPAFRVLVSNVGQGDDDQHSTSGDDLAQLFHTGATHDYTLTSVIVVSQDSAGDDFDVEVCEADTTADQFPTSTCTALTRPSSFAAGGLEFTHDGLALSANSNYVVVIDPDGTETLFLDSTTSGGEDSTGLTGWSIKDKFYLNSGTTWAQKSGGNEALRITVNGYERALAPTVTGVALTSTTAPYGIGEDVEATVTFSAAVDISGSPKLELDFDGAAKEADCATGTTTTTMVCSYTVLVNDSAPNGVAIAANKLSGGTITATGSTSAADLDHSAVAIQSGHKVDGIRPTLITTGANAPTTSTDGTKVILTFSEALGSLNSDLSRFIVTVTTSGMDASGSVTSATFSGSRVTVTHIGVVSLTSTVGIAVIQQAVADLAGNGNPRIALTTVTNAVVAAVAPTVTAVEITTTASVDGFHTNGQRIQVDVTFSAAVDITGSPQLELDFDGSPKAATCTAATNTTTMACRYTIGGTDSAPDGIAIAANKLTLNGGTITATGSTTINADLDHAAVAIDAGDKVDGILPTLVTTGPNAPRTSTDGTKVILTFSETLSQVERTLFTIKSGTDTLSTTAASLTGTEQTTVELTLATALTASATNLTVGHGAGAFRDVAGNGSHHRTTPTLATTVTNAVVATTTPTVTGVALTSTTAPYRVGEDVEATVTFSAAVDISGSPKLQLNFDGAAKEADCATGTNTTTMVCSYTVLVNDSAPNGVVIAADKLSGGTITAIGSTTAAVLTHSAVAIQAGHKVDGIRPTLVTTGANAPTTSADGTQVILTFSEAVPGVNRFNITIGIGGGNVAQTSAARTAGATVELDLSTVIDATVTLTVALAGSAVFDRAGNGNLALAATAVTNAVGATTTVSGTARILVSNVSQLSDNSANLSGNDHAQLFHTSANTGSNTGGWTLTSLIVVSEDAEGDDFDVEVCEADTTANEFPTSTCTALTRPASFTAGSLEFTHAGLALSANSNYVVMIKQDGGGSVTLDSTTAAGEDPAGLTGWSIKNYFYWNNSGTWQNQGGQNEVLQFTVNGYERALVFVTAPTVTAVALTSNPGSDNTYAIGEDVEATVTFSAAVDISGAPRLELDFAGTAKQAACATGTNTPTMVCSYEVAVGDLVPTGTTGHGIAIGANKLTGGTITATGTTTAAVLTHSAVASTFGHKVDGIRPTLLTTGTDAPTTFVDGFRVHLSFSEPLGAVDHDKITIRANGADQPTSAAIENGVTVQVTLATALTSTSTNITVALAADAVEDVAGNGILAVGATGVTNVVGVANLDPSFPSTEDGLRSVPEDTQAGDNIGDPVSAVDPDQGDMLTYSLSGTDAGSFEIADATGQLRVATGVELDYEGKRTYRVTVQVSDGKDENDADDMGAIDDRQNVTITVTNVNEPPVVMGEAAPSIAENSSSAVANYTATDPERDTITWSVSDPANFWISDRGQLYFRTPPNFEDRTTYTVTVSATDDDVDNPLSSSLSGTITVKNVEEQGVVTISPPRGWVNVTTTFSADLSDGDIVTGTIVWKWERSPNGRSNWTNIDGETFSSYTAAAADANQYLRATASYTDGLGSGKTASATLQTPVGDARPAANTEPTFAEATATRTVSAGTAAGRSVGAPVRATDSDQGDVLTYSLGGADANAFDIDAATGQVWTKDVLDSVTKDIYTVTVEVHDGFDANYNLSDASDAAVTVTITVTAVAQRTSGGGGGGGGGGFGPAPTAPKFVDGFRTQRPLAVTARAGDTVGDPVSATHPEDDDVTYTLSGTDANLFTVDEETGQLRLGQGATLELGQTYTVNLTATDSSGTGAIIIVVIAVAEGVGDPYDLNHNGTIEKDEVLEAVADYFAGHIEKDEVLALVARYFAG